MKNKVLLISHECCCTLLQCLLYFFKTKSYDSISVVFFKVMEFLEE